MDTDHFDRMVGRIVARYVCAKYAERLFDEDFDGGFHVLSGFTPSQLAGFCDAIYEEQRIRDRVSIRFPASALADAGLPKDALTEHSAVAVRNRSYEQRLVVTAEMERDAAASLAECDRTDVEDIRSDLVADLWLECIASSVGVILIEDTKRYFIAALKGLFETAQSNLRTTCQFLSEVLRCYEEEGSVERAIGRNLPCLDMPRWVGFSVPAPRRTQPSAWRDAFKKHGRYTCYLRKRDTNYVVLDEDELRSTLARFRDDSDAVFPDGFLEAFERYIDSGQHRCDATENLLFSYDWDYTSQCFTASKRTDSASFIDQTIQTLIGDDVSISDEDDVLLEQLRTRLPRAGEASEDVVAFFDTHRGSLAENPRLLGKWENLIYGSKVTCEDLRLGILACVERCWSSRSEGGQLRVRLVGQGHSKLNGLKRLNPAACQYFERNYAGLQRESLGRVLFQETLVTKYSDEGNQQWLRANEVRKQLSRKANTLQFRAVVEEKSEGSTDYDEIGTCRLEWRFRQDSILAEEGADLSRLAKISESGTGTSLIECRAHYESTGRKGVPVAVELQDAGGLSNTHGGGGRGSLVPAIARAQRHSLLDRWQRDLKSFRSQNVVSSDQCEELDAAFQEFHRSYTQVLQRLAHDALWQADIPQMVEFYRALILTVCQLKHEGGRRSLLRTLLTIGNAEIEKSGTRPALSIICPWHPLRLEALWAQTRQYLRRLRRLLADGNAGFSDASGRLFFRDAEALLTQPLGPDVSVVWRATQPLLRLVSQSVGGYTLHEPITREEDNSVVSYDDSKGATEEIISIIEDYLRLQPHEQDNLSVALYDCDSASLPAALVARVGKLNDDRPDRRITCHVFLMHRDYEHLRAVYRDLVAGGDELFSNGLTDATDGFLSKVRVNIVAARAMRRASRTEPIDIVYCRDIISRRAALSWVNRPRITLAASELEPHQWTRRHRVTRGTRQAMLQLCCPAQTDAGWAYLYAMASLLHQDASDSWTQDKCPVPMRVVDFDMKEVRDIFAGTHELAAWVVNQDEILDRQLLEAQSVRVIRYIQSATQGRNLIISSKAREGLLISSLKERLRELLP